jgi:glutaredoxin
MTAIEPQVEVFTQPHCAPCRDIERFLRERNVPFVLRDVAADPQALETLARAGFMATPVTRIGERWIAGFRRQALLAALHEASLP